MRKIVVLSFFAVLLLIGMVYASVPDEDSDGVPDAQDRCLNSLTDVVDQFGCSCMQKNCISDNNPCTDDCAAINGLAVCNVDNNNPCSGGSCLGGVCVSASNDCRQSGGETSTVKRPECSPSWKGYSSDSSEALREAFCKAIKERSQGVVMLRGSSYIYYYNKDFVSDTYYSDCNPNGAGAPAVVFDGQGSTLKTSAEKVQIMLPGSWQFKNINVKGPFENGANKPCGPTTRISCRCFEGGEGCSGERFTNGINGARQHNWMIKDSSINGFGGNGILAAGSDNIQIINNRITWNAGAGIALYKDNNGYSGTNAIVTGNSVEYNGHDGIDLGTINSQITDNVFSNNGWGEYGGDGSGILLCDGGSGSRIYRNTAEGNREHGIDLACRGSIRNVQFEENSVKQNRLYGINFEGALSGISVTDNEAAPNSLGCMSSDRYPGVEYQGNDCGEIDPSQGGNIGPQSTIVIIVGIGDNPPPMDVATARESIFGNNFGTVNDFYLKDSYGQTSLTGRVVGPYQLPNSVCSVGDIQDAAIVASDPDVNFRQYSRIIIFHPDTACTGFYGGRGEIGKVQITTQDGNIRASISWIKSDTSWTVAHELGHNFGLWHANSKNCLTCPSIEYGNRFSVMGDSGLRHLDSIHKEIAGWPSNSVTATEGDYLLKPLETKQSGIQQIKIPLPSGNYYALEFRQPIDYDAGASNSIYSGVFMYLHDNSITSNLINFYSRDQSPLLQIDNTYHDITNNLEISLKSVDSNGALVSIKPYGTSPSITILSPNDGEVWMTNRLQTITWRSDRIPQDQLINSVNLIDATGKVERISLISNTPNDGSEQITIPLVLPGTYNLEIKTEFNGQLIADSSDKPFYIFSEPCTDSDGGGDYYVKGKTTNIIMYPDSYRNYIAENEDKCNEDKRIYEGISEGYCDENGVGHFDLINNACPNGCIDGACIQDPTQPECEDSDGGMNYYTKGTATDSEYPDGLTDHCQDKAIFEYSCYNGKIKLNTDICQYGCQDGACLKEVTKRECPSGLPNLLPSGNVKIGSLRGSATLSWPSVKDAANYIVTLDDGTFDRYDDPSLKTCDYSQHYFCEETAQNQITSVPIRAGRSYYFSVQPVVEGCNVPTGTSVFTVSIAEEQMPVLELQGSQNAVTIKPGDSLQVNVHSAPSYSGVFLTMMSQSGIIIDRESIGTASQQGDLWRTVSGPNTKGWPEGQYSIYIQAGNLVSNLITLTVDDGINSGSVPGGTDTGTSQGVDSGNNNGGTPFSGSDSADNNPFNE